jgi:hypothetical protein
MEMLLLQLGGAVAKSVLSLWLGKVAVVGDMSGVAIDALLERVPSLGIIERRRATRQFDRMAEAVAEKLAPFLDVEFGGLPENERAAAVLAVADAIERAGVTSELLLAQDLDPLRLEAHVRTAAMGEREQLVPAAGVLYDHLLREACNYVVEIAVTLPPFASQAARESLRRETEIIDLIRTVLSKLPEPALAGGDGEDADARFETQYRRTLTRLLDRLELFGLDVSPLSKRYALSVAYITLSASDPEADEDAEAGYVRVNEALAGSPRMLLRGDAGSGKTTLLQWLAVTSARQGFDNALAHWNGTVPFFIQLRRHADGELPAPERFLDDATPNLTGAMPAGWVHRQLNAGRALVLVDGVDELPEDERQRAREWLLNLAGTFDSARYVVSSRPTTPEGWLAEGAFRQCMLQAMTLADVDSFIDHWHNAIRSALPDEANQGELDQLGTALKATLRARPPIRSLATSPLLCAMLCALHRERSEQLPADRMELYRVALEMLLERRDVERRIGGVERLPLKEKQLLLRDFAYWLVLNNYIDADQTAAVERVAHKIESMPRVNEDPSVVFRYLLERSGVLRAPVEGRIDFVHRTFQEYLAAEEASEQDHIGLLVDNAHHDQWREVIILAAGHATLRQREALLRGLLDRGVREREERHRLHLLAVACLETSPEVPAGLTAELQNTLSHLLPPKNMSEAKAVASAGQLAVPLLAQFHAERSRVAAACVRALTLVGGDDALNALAAYGRDDRVTVAVELLRAWESFEPVEFARRVLADSPLRYGRLRLYERTLVPGLRYLRRLSSLTLGSNVPLSDLEGVRGTTSLVTLEATVSSEFSDLSPLATAGRLQQLDLANCVGLSDLAPLSNLTGLLILKLHSSKSLVDLTPLSGLRNLVELTVSKASSLQNLAPVTNLTQLSSLDLSGSAVTDLTPLANLTKLHTLNLSGSAVTDLTPLANLTQLRILNLHNCRGIRDLSPLSGLAKLNQVSLAGCEDIDDFSPLSGKNLILTVDQYQLRHIPSRLMHGVWIRVLQRGPSP